MTPTELRDRVMRLAKDDADAALRLAREIPDAWFRAQALAAVARWIGDAQVKQVAAEALVSAEECPDDYKRAAVAAWPIRALLERGDSAGAAEALRAARQRALAASPASSRAYALWELLQAAWSLGAPTRIRLVEDIAAVHELDTFWRVGRCLVEAIVILRVTEPDVASQIAQGITDPRCRSKAADALASRGPCVPREFFRG